MKIFIQFLFVLFLNIAWSQKLENPTFTSGFMSNTANNVVLTSSIGEGSPVTELNLGAVKLTQGYFQYQLKKTSHIVNNDGKIELSLYPNPTSKLINIDLKESGYGSIEFSIENILGQKIMTINKTRVKGSTEIFSIDIEALPISNYIVNINYIDESKTISIKFSKQ
jgi:hypothetical protein